MTIPLKAVTDHGSVKKKASTDLDIDDARHALASGSVGAARTVAKQATFEQAKIDKMRTFLDGLENRLLTWKGSRIYPKTYS